MADLLVCGGLPRSATTYLYNELRNREHVFQSRIKESFLFERGDHFIDCKLRSLRSDKIYLDFTPEYIFSRDALKKIAVRNVNCFFVLREFGAYKASLEGYLDINGLRNDFLSAISESAFREACSYAADHFPTFAFSDIESSKIDVVKELEATFGLDFGRKMGTREERNSSNSRRYYAKALFNNYFSAGQKLLTSVAFGLV